MIGTSQKIFEVEFGVGEKVEIIDFNLKGSYGYIESIEIDENGIWYNVCLTHIARQNNRQGYDELKPQIVKLLKGNLKARR